MQPNLSPSNRTIPSGTHSLLTCSPIPTPQQGVNSNMDDLSLIPDSPIVLAQWQSTATPAPVSAQGDALRSCFSDRPFQGVASGTPGNYCTAFPKSHYYTKAFQKMWRFYLLPDGQGLRPTYCLEKGKTGPLREERRYQAVPAEQAFPTASATQRSQLAWILLHTYPHLSVNEQFAQAGVNPATSPALDENDAYAAAQIALWSIFNPPEPGGWIFYICNTEEEHPKSPRLQRTVASLFQRSLEAARAEELPLPCGADGCRTATIPGLACLDICGTQELAQGRVGWLYGPIRVHARQPFTLSLEACCAADAPATPPVLVDEAQAPIAAPANGQPFYIRFPPNVRENCYHLTLRVTRPGVCAAVMEDIANPDRMQALGTTALATEADEATSACFCCYAPRPCPDPQECPACPEPLPCPVCPACPKPPVCPVCPKPPECPKTPECPERPTCPEPPECPKPPCPKSPCCPPTPRCPPQPFPPPCRCRCEADFPSKPIRTTHGSLDLCPYCFSSPYPSRKEALHRR